MRKQQQLSKRHERVIYRLCDLAFRAREYCAQTNDGMRMRELRSLAVSALEYSAAVRTLAAPTRRTRK